MVGGLVEQKQIRFLEEDFAEGDAHLPAAGIIPHQLFGPLGAEANGGQQFVDAGVELVAVQRLETAVQPA